MKKEHYGRRAPECNVELPRVWAGHGWDALVSSGAPLEPKCILSPFWLKGLNLSQISPHPPSPCGCCRCGQNLPDSSGHGAALETHAWGGLEVVLGQFALTSKVGAAPRSVWYELEAKRPETGGERRPL